MDVRKASLCLVFACVLLSVVMEVNGKKKRKQKPHHSKDLDDELHRLEQSIEALQGKVDDLSSHPEGKDSNSHVHLHFHGDEHDHDHQDDDNNHVDVYLHTDGHGGHRGHRGHRDHAVVAHCELKNADVTGSVHIVHEADEKHANFLFSFDHLGDADTEHAIHVHEFGDMSDGCNTLGGHYNPQNTMHDQGQETEAIPSDKGDLGKLLTDSDGAVVDVWNNDTHLCLVGPNSIMGRSIKVHKADGSNLACCVIGLVSMGDDDDHGKHHGDHHGKHHGDDHGKHHGDHHSHDKQQNEGKP